MKNQDFHFYAVNIFKYATTNDKRDLRELLKLMAQDDVGYELWYVPTSHGLTYKINHYRPVVDGIIFMGHYEVKAKRK
jgi:hypothetical protein